MFDIGFPELLVVALIALLVLGPDRLPEAMRTLGLMFGRLRRTYLSARAEIEREVGMDDVRRQLHNESIMQEFKSIDSGIKSDMNHLDKDIKAAVREEQTTDSHDSHDNQGSHENKAVQEKHNA